MLWRTLCAVYSRWRRRRQYARARLTVELVPSSTWGVNLRSVLPSERWNRLRQRVYRRAGYRCEVCGERGIAHPVECHERWEYDDARHVQRLVGLIALCPDCHSVKHIGRSYSVGDGERALAQLTRVNGWTREDALAYVDRAFDIHAVRSRANWRVDLDYLSNRRRSGW